MNSSLIDENNIVYCPSGDAWVATLEDSIISKKLVVTMFYTSWSQPSKAVYDILVQQKQVFADVIFSKLDVDEDKEMATIMGVRIVPTVLFMQGGKEVARLKVSVTPELLRQKILSLLQLQQS